MEQLYAAGHSPHGGGFTGNGLHGRKENYVGGWKVITCCTVSTPRDVSTSQPLKKNNSPQLGWGQILLQAVPRSPVKTKQKELRPAYPLKHWALSQLSLVFLTRPVFQAGPRHPSPHSPPPLGQFRLSSPGPEAESGRGKHAPCFQPDRCVVGEKGTFLYPQVSSGWPNN